MHRLRRRRPSTAFRSLTPLIATVLLLAACDDDDAPTAPGDDANLAVRDTVLTRPWSEGDLSAMAYDADHDALFLLQDVHAADNVIHRWNFGETGLSEVYRYESQHDYGMRWFDGELWIARTYDQAVLRLDNLAAPSLGVVVDHDHDGNPLAIEIGDMARLGSDVVYVACNTLTSDQPDGVQVLRAPAFDDPEVLVSERQLGWPILQSALWRSVVVVGDSTDARIVATTGPADGDLVVFDTQGRESFRAPGFGKSYLQTDSQGRVYATGEDRIVRWSSDFSEREDFEYELPSWLRFVLRETSRHVEFVYGEFRSEEPTIGRIRLPR
ncbi:MAG TPA: hypothetical protein VKA86_17880 [Candidatus Krumholzibacteria bacterium]|nr:hypothetical protein [Candidatus Krumholzibacteria bacterium]